MNLRRWCTLLLCVAPVALSGCTLWHNLQPHRLRRLNRVSPPHLDPEFTQRESPRQESLILRAQNDEFFIAR